MNLRQFLQAAMIIMIGGGPALAWDDFNSSLTSLEGFDRQTPQEIEQARQKIKDLFKDQIEPQSLSENEKFKTLSRYGHLDPKKEVPTDLLETATLFFDKNKKKFSNQDYMVVVDLGPRSDNFRFFLVNLKSGLIEKHRTTHGHGSDSDRDGVAEYFGNVINSGASSLGFVRTAEVYSGKFQRSLRLDGLSKTNTNLRTRAVVLHGWDEVHEAPVIQGLTWGCLTLDWNFKDKIIDKLQTPSLIYVGASEK